MNREVLSEFLYSLEEEKKLTKFLKIIFKYKVLHDYNYISRIVVNDKSVILDVYDNILENRFNRYIFSFTKGGYDFKLVEDKNVFVSYINILNLYDSDNKLLKFGYLFRIRKNKMIDYAKTFLTDEIVKCLEEVLD